MATYLVTGGAGFIGSHLVEALAQQGHAVRVIDDLSGGHLSNLAAVESQIEFVQADIATIEAGALTELAAGVEAIFHLAAMVSVPQSMTEPERAETVNAMGTLKLLQAAQRGGAHRLVLSSTCAVYGDEPTLPKIEPMLPEPLSPYAISKLAAEQYCLLFNRSFGVEAVVLRYFNVFGPRQDPSSPYSGVISIFVNRMGQGLTPLIYGDGEQTRDFVYVADVVQANLLAAAAADAAGQVFNIGTGRAVSVNHLYQTVAGLLNFPHPPNYQPPRAGDILHSYANAAHANQTLGWQPQVAFEEGLRRLVAA